MWEYLANSNFFASLFGAMVGAGSAALLARRQSRRDRLRDEILACNVAIAQCISIANSFVAMKRQSVLPMLQTYRRQCELVAAIVAGGARGAGPTVLSLDLRHLMVAWVPVEALGEMIGSRIVRSARPSILSASVAQAVHNQHRAVLGRNALVDRFKAMSNNEKFPLYFGSVAPGGHVDRSYLDAMDAISLYTDDCLYFSILLADVLTEHGLNLAFELTGQCAGINRADFTSVDSNILPNPANYHDFERVFRPKKVDMVVSM